MQTSVLILMLTSPCKYNTYYADEYKINQILLKLKLQN